VRTITTVPGASSRTSTPFSSPSSEAKPSRVRPVPIRCTRAGIPCSSSRSRRSGIVVVMMSSSRSSASTLPDNHCKLRGTCSTRCEVCRYAGGNFATGSGWSGQPGVQRLNVVSAPAFTRSTRIPLVTRRTACATARDSHGDMPQEYGGGRAHVSALVQTMIRTLPVAAVLAAGLVDAHARTGANAYPDPLRLLFLVNIGQPHVRLAPVAFPHGLQRGDSGLGHSLTPVWAVHCARLRPQLDRRPSIEIASVMVRRLRSRSLREPHTALSRCPSPSAPGTVPRGRRARPRFPSAGGERRHGRASPSR